MKNIDSTGNILHVDKVNYAPFSVVKQEDNLVLTVDLFRAGQELDVTGQTIELGAKRADNVVVQQIEGFTINKNKVTIALKNNVIAVAGIVQCELHIKDSSGAFTTSNFTLRVSEKLLGENSLNASDNIAGLEKVKNDFLVSSNNLKNDFISTSEKLKTDFKVAGDKQIADQKADYESLKDIITTENPTAKLQAQINKNTARSTSNEDRIDKIENVLPVWQEQAGEGSVTIQDGFEGELKDLVISGKTIGGYNSETQQYDTIVSSCEGENNVLKVRTYGKNLLNEVWYDGTIDSITGVETSVPSECKSDFIEIPEETIKLYKHEVTSLSNPYSHYKMRYYDLNKKYIGSGGGGWNYASKETTILEGAKFLKMIPFATNKSVMNDVKVIVSSTIATSYEPYQEDKKEILLPCSHRILNSYNGETGKYIEGSATSTYIGAKEENWVLNDTSEQNVTSFRIKQLDKKTDSFVICDRFKNIQVNPQNKEGIFSGNGDWAILFRISKSKLESQDVAGFKKWLQANPTTVAYELAEPIVHNIDKMILKQYDGTTHLMIDNEVKGNVSCKAKVSLSSQNNRLREENKSLKNDTGFLAGTLLSMLEATALPTTDDDEKRKLLNKLLEIKNK